MTKQTEFFEALKPNAEDDDTILKFKTAGKLIHEICKTLQLPYVLILADCTKSTIISAACCEAHQKLLGLQCLNAAKHLAEGDNRIDTEFTESMPEDFSTVGEC